MFTVRWIVLAILGSACARIGIDEAEVHVYVGEVDAEHPTSVAIASQGGRLAAYFCSDDPEQDDYAGWFDGAGPFRLERDGWVVEGEFTESGVSGVLLEPDGSSERWTATTPADPLAGLYVRRGRQCLTAVIVADASPSAPLVRGAWWCDEEGGDVRQVTPLLPLTFEEERLLVEVDIDGEMRRLEVAPLSSVPP